MLAFKLGRIERCLRADPYHTNAARYARQAGVCRALAEQLLADEYGLKEWAELQIRFQRPTGVAALTTPHTPEYDAALVSLWAAEDAARQRDLDGFWRVFKRYYRNWWV